MTVGELYGAVAYLGFETRLEDEALRRGFYAALGRALAQVNLLRPRHRRAAFLHRRLRNLLGELTPVLHKAGTTEELLLPTETRTFAVAVSGTGEIILSDGKGERSFRFSTPRETVIRGEVTGQGRLTMAGGDFSVNAVGVYSDALPFGKAVPGRGVAYPMRELEPDFLSFRHPALYFQGKAADVGVLFEGDTLRLPEDAPEGMYEVDLNLGTPSYRAEDGDEGEIPLDADLASLLPELIASLIWLEDSPERAAYYASVYQRGCARLASRERGAPTDVISLNGW